MLTNANGEFQFRSLPPGKYTLTANASGYSPSTDVVVTVTSAEAARVEIYLEPVVVSLDEVEVTADRPLPSVGRQSLGGTEIQGVPGTAGDALRALQSLPAVGVANDFSGALYIRGGSG